MTAYKRFTVVHQDGVTILRLLDTELSDLELQDELHDELMRLVNDDKPQRLLVNFATVTYCTTGIINSLLSVKKLLQESGGVVKMCGFTKHVHDAFAALNLEGTVFEVHESEQAAVASF